MSDGYQYTVLHHDKELMENKFAHEASEKRLEWAFEPLEKYILPSEDRRFEADRTDLEETVVIGSYEAKKVLKGGGTVDAAAKRVSYELSKLAGPHFFELQNLIAQRTKEKLDAMEGEA